MLQEIAVIASGEFAAILDFDGTVEFTLTELNGYVQDYIKEIDTVAQTLGVSSWKPNDPTTSQSDGVFSNNSGLNLYVIGNVPMFVSYISASVGFKFNTEILGLYMGKQLAVAAYIAERAKTDLKLVYEGSFKSIQTHTGNPGSYNELKSLCISQGNLADSAPAVLSHGIGVNILIGDYIKKETQLKQMMKAAGGFEQGLHLIPQYLIDQCDNYKIDAATFKSLASQASALLMAYGVSDPEFEKLSRLLGI